MNTNNRMKTRKTRKARQRGGRKIGEGSYGCVFSPALRCKGDSERTPDTISKLMHKLYATAEFNTATVIREIDPEQKFSIYPSRMCELDPANIYANAANDRYLDCKRLAVSSIDEMAAFADEYRVIEMPYGGVELNDFKVTDIKEILSFFDSLLPLIRGMVLMHSKRYYHFDIKAGNIVTKRLEDGKYLTRLIDFGFGTKGRDLVMNSPKVLIPIEQNYPIWPFDFRWLTNKTSGKYATMAMVDYEAFNRHINEYYTVSVKYNSTSAPRTAYYNKDGSRKEGIVSYMAYLHGVMGKDEEYIHDMYGKVDVYSFGLVLSKLFTTFMNQYKLEDGEIYVWTGQQHVKADTITPAEGATATMVRYIRDTVTRPFYEFIEKLLAADPRKRYTMADVEREFPAILVLLKKAGGAHAHVGRMITKRLKEETPYIGNLFPEFETPAAAPAPTPTNEKFVSPIPAANNYVILNMPLAI